MLQGLGNIIEKRPWLVISFVLLITIGFSILLPSLEMKTDFKDFMPDDEIVTSFWDVTQIFGQSQVMMFLYIKSLQADNALSINALREMQYIEQELLKLDEVDGAISITTILDQICFLEFGDMMQNCTDEQLGIVINDILKEDFSKSIQIFEKDDPNENVDFNRFPRISRGKSIDDIDIKNCYISYSDDSYTFSFEVYDLASLKNKLKSPIPFSNVVEWYLDFENIIRPDPLLDIDYKIYFE